MELQRHKHPPQTPISITPTHSPSTLPPPVSLSFDAGGE